MKFQQSRFAHDRAQRYLFALTVENRITGAASAVSKAVGDELTKISEIRDRKSKDEDDILKNGSILRIYLKGFFPFEEMSDLSPISFDECKSSMVVDNTDGV